jgi:hypothetical protein
MANDPQTNNQGGMSSDGAMNAARQAAQSGQALSPQQPGESAEVYAQRQSAYNQAKAQGKQS